MEALQGLKAKAKDLRYQGQGQDLNFRLKYQRQRQDLNLTLRTKAKD